jgi:hypothetical protein
MPRPRVRFTVRRMMVAVAIVAMMVYAEKLRRLSDVYAEEARHNREQADALMHWYLERVMNSSPVDDVV